MIFEDAQLGGLEDERGAGAMRKWKCNICGYIHEGDQPPDKCPVCGAPKEEFVEVTS